GGEASSPSPWEGVRGRATSNNLTTPLPAEHPQPQTRMLFVYLKQPKLISQAILVTALPLLSYIYIYIRGAQHPEWRGEGEWPTAWDWFTDFITIQQGQDELGPGLSLENFFTAEFPALMAHELTWLVLVGGLLGITCLGKRRAIFLYSTLAIYMLFCWAYRFGNWFQVIIPVYPIFLIGVAAGVEALYKWQWLNPLHSDINPYSDKNLHFDINIDSSRKINLPPSPKPVEGELASTGSANDFWEVLKVGTVPHSDKNLTTVSQKNRAPVLIILNLLMLILVGYRLTTNLPRANQQGLPTDTGLFAGWAVLADQPPANITLYTDFEERVALQYLQTMWQLAPTMRLDDIVEPSAEPRYITRRALTADPTLLDLHKQVPYALGEQIIMLTEQPLTALPDQATPVVVPFGESLTLQGYHINPSPDNFSNTQITLYWHTDQPLPADYTISVRPLHGGQPISLNDAPLIQDHQPVWGLYPTSRWRVNELIADMYTLPLPVQPNALQIVIYYAIDDGFENLAVQVIELE
ncbi:hypothetical protein QUF64_13410, partial [Anaerolineales bacterium HSG6]|nr:hypothetical protein [Anaerolineales bacterium HSG6]